MANASRLTIINIQTNTKEIEMARKPVTNTATPKAPIKSMATRKKPEETKYTEEQIREQIHYGTIYVGIEGVRHALLSIAMLEYNSAVGGTRNEQASEN